MGPYLLGPHWVWRDGLKLSPLKYVPSCEEHPGVVEAVLKSRATCPVTLAPDHAGALAIGKRLERCRDAFACKSQFACVFGLLFGLFLFGASNAFG